VVIGQCQLVDRVSRPDESAKVPSELGEVADSTFGGGLAVRPRGLSPRNHAFVAS
jgi:hypothetical protein